MHGGWGRQGPGFRGALDLMGSLAAHENESGTNRLTSMLRFHDEALLRRITLELRQALTLTSPSRDEAGRTEEFHTFSGLLPPQQRPTRPPFMQHASCILGVLIISTSPGPTTAG